MSSPIKGQTRRDDRARERERDAGTSNREGNL